MKTGDKVKSSKALWGWNEIGVVSGIVEREDSRYGNLVHVIFPETDKHYAYQQSFDSVSLTIIKEEHESTAN